MKKFVIIFFLLLFIYLVIPNEAKDKIEVVKQSEEEIVTISYQDDLIQIPINQYIYHVLACEVPASFEEESLKAMAVAIRTYYYYKIAIDSDYVSTNSDQCYISDDALNDKWKDNYSFYKDKLMNIVYSTEGEVIKYDDEIIIPFYFSMSNGYTENSSDVFVSSLPYLVSTSSDWESKLPSFEVTSEISVSEFSNKLGIEGNIVIENVSYTPGERVNYITINGKTFRGTEVRKLLGLRSADFDININDSVYITTRGYGHGVGMSQYGSNEMAKEGYSYKDILKYYYNGVEIVYNS